MRQERIVNFYPTVLWGVGSGVCYYTARSFPNGWISGVFIVAGVFMFAAAGINFVLFISYRSVLLYEQYRRVANESQLSKFADSVRGLNTNQINLLNQAMFNEPLVSDEPMTVIKGVEIPDRWIMGHFDRAKGFYLFPIRNYSAGSNQRKWAKLVEDELVEKGAAAKNKGNKSARVHTWPGAWKALGWE